MYRETLNRALSEVIDCYIISNADANKPKLELNPFEHTVLLRALIFMFTQY